MKYAKYTETFNEDKDPSDPTRHQYHFTSVPCPGVGRECGTTEVLTVNGTDLFAYNQGELIQNAFPYLTPAQRDRLIHGLCEPCFDRLGEED